MAANDPIKAAQKLFFDRPYVIAAVGRKAAAVLARTGGYARTTMKRGMRYRQAISTPGDYPSAHGGKDGALLRKFIFFGYDTASKSVAVGPVLLALDKTIVAGERKVTKLVNEGGAVTRRIVRKGISTQYRYRQSSTQVVRQVYRARPFVNLTAPIAAKALADNMAKMPLR